jgi:hypothetical protein
LGFGVVVCGCIFVVADLSDPCVYVGCVVVVWMIEGESCITVFPRVYEWELGISQTDCLVLGRLAGRDNWITLSSWGEEAEADVVLVGLCRGRGAPCVVGSNPLAALSSDAFRLMLSVISCS